MPRPLTVAVIAVVISVIAILGIALTVRTHQIHEFAVATVTVTATGAVSVEPTATAPDMAAGPSTPTATILPASQVETATPLSTGVPLPTTMPQGLSRTVPRASIQHAWQTWNNCGPATLAMNLSYYSLDADQAIIGTTLRQHPDDKNVGPAELATYARDQGLHARVQVNGSEAILRRLIDAGIPVLIETWLDPADAGGLGHYRLIVGYDDAQSAWIAYDSYISENPVSVDGDYSGIWLSYAETETLWKVFNRTFVLVYSPEDAAVVEEILGGANQDDIMWQAAIRRAQSEIGRNAEDVYAWFNLGSSLTALASYEEAAFAYDRARQIGLPWRMMWYQFGPFETYHAEERYQDVIALADSILSPDVQIEEIHFWRGKSLLSLGDSEGAQQAWQEASRLNPTFAAMMNIQQSGE